MKQAIINHFDSNFHTFFEKYLQKIQKIGGQEFKAICPFHEDTNPSLSFNNQTGQFFCHGCKEKGDIFNFYSKVKSLNVSGDFKKIPALHRRHNPSQRFGSGFFQHGAYITRIGELG